MNENKSETLPAQIAATIVTVDDDMKARLATAFAGMAETAQQWMAKAVTLKVTSVDQVDLMADCKVFRLQLRDIRIKAGEAHKRLKGPILPYSRALDACERTIRTACEDVEEYLVKQERFAELKAEEEKRQRTKERLEELSKIGVSSPMYSTQAEMFDASQWVAFVQSMVDGIAAQRAREQAAKEAEATRAAEARKLAEENRALREQNERIAEEKAAADRALARAKSAAARPAVVEPVKPRASGAVTLATWRTTNDAVNHAIRFAIQTWADRNEQLVGFTVKLDGFTDAFVTPKPQ